MELREYRRLIVRWWWIPTLLAVAVAALTLAVGDRVRQSYQATVRFVVSVPPQASGAEGGSRSYDPRYYAFLSTEYLVDDLSEIVGSRVFAQAVAAELNDPAISPEMIQSAERPKKTHRVLSVAVTTADPDLTGRIASAIGRVLESRGPELLAQYPGDVVAIRQIDPAVVVPVVAGSRSYIDLAVRVALALAAGVGLALLLEYVDTSVRDADDVERLLGVPVLGEIPAESAGARRGVGPAPPAASSPRPAG
ncbi:MAG: hypothetical protein HY331_11205 [Chloroflexi bacterium]|nr:hypothetical protein [Chloroflexota bacterium]